MPVRSVGRSGRIARMALTALACFWDDPDRCPQVRRDGVTGLRYCRMCGCEDDPPEVTASGNGAVTPTAEPAAEGR